MVTYVLDASSVLRYLEGEAGGARVAQILKEAMRGECRVLISAIQWGEVAGKILKSHNRQICNSTLARLSFMGVEVVAASGDSAVGSALIKIQKKVPYADAFAVELTASTQGSILLTGDFDFKPAAHDIKIEFLPKK